ncbi:MAG: hypothetical protein LUE90_06575 [Clostridiales bacterium]|nr:hypothetical protein [Clostridiales bacterium]
MNQTPNKKRNIITLIAIIMLLILLFMIMYRQGMSNYQLYEEYLQEQSAEKE